MNLLLTFKFIDIFYFKPYSRSTALLKSAKYAFLASTNIFILVYVQLYIFFIPDSLFYAILLFGLLSIKVVNSLLES